MRIGPAPLDQSAQTGAAAVLSGIDNAQLASVDIAIGKAVTASHIKRPAKAFSGSVAPENSPPRMQSCPRHSAGRLPTVIDGKVVCAAGVAANQDAEVAAAGLAAAK